MAKQKRTGPTLGTATLRICLATLQWFAGDEDAEIESVFHDLPINDGPFTLDEYRAAKQSLRAGKKLRRRRGLLGGSQVG